MTAVALHVGQLLQPIPGGIGTYVRELLRTVSTSITLTAFAAGPRPAEVSVEYTDLGWPRGALRYETWDRVGRPRLSLDTDVIHGPSLAVPPARLRNGRTAGLVVTVHDIAFVRHPEYFTKRGVRFHQRGLERAHATADIIVTPSAFTRGELGREGFDLDRVIAIPHGISVPARPTGDAITATLTTHHLTKPFVLAVGTVEPRKGLDTAAMAVARARNTNPDLTLVVVGPEGWNEVRGLDHPWVRRLGAVNANDLEALFAAASACVVPSRYEGFGLPALEAMARGCPTIVADSSSLPEVTGDSALRLPPDDIDAWGDALAMILGDSDLQEHLASSGQERARQFSWDAAATAHVAAYERAASRMNRNS